MNKNLLRSQMVLHGDTNVSLAKFLNISEQAFSAKINDKGTEFKQSEIAAITKRYNLTPDQVVSIFFTKEVAN